LVSLAAFVVTSFCITGLVRQAHRRGEERREQARLLDLTHDAIIGCDMDQVITHWNRGAEEFYGWKREDALGRHAAYLLQARDPVRLGEARETLRRTGRWEGEIGRTRRDGTQVWASSRWSLQRDYGGRPIGTIETSHDITERKRAQEALHRLQAAYLAEAQRLSSTGSFGWDVASGEISWSDENYRIFGYDPAIKPSLDIVMQRVHPDDRAVVRELVRRVVNDPQGV